MMFPIISSSLWDFFTYHEEYTQVKAMTGSSRSPWYTDNQLDGIVWMIDSVLKIKGAMGTQSKKLIKVGAETVQQMKEKIDNDLLTLA